MVRNRKPDLPLLISGPHRVPQTELGSAAQVVYNSRPMKDLLKELIRADSTAGRGELGTAKVIEAEFRRHGVDCRIDRWDENRANVVAHVRSSGRRKGLLFVCHSDVVGPGEEPWSHPPFEPAEVGGRIYGRGTVDMKGGIAAAMAAICDVVDSGVKLQGDLIFAATAGEETDSNGVERFMHDTTWLPKLAGIVVPEPTSLAVVTAHRGILWLHIGTKGKAVHSSMPQRGVNAIMHMKRVLDELEHYEISCPPHPLLGPCSLSINRIRGGEAMNIVPDRCMLGIDIRTLPGQNPEAIRDDIEHLLAQLKTSTPHFESELSVSRVAQAMETDPECEFVKQFCSAVGVDMTNVVGFTTDAPHLVPLKAPIIIYGPGRPDMCHQTNESIETAELEAAAATFKNAVLHFLS
jgi:succinyl-diaminopimelate desuccinylase